MDHLFGFAVCAAAVGGVFLALHTVNVDQLRSAQRATSIVISGLVLLLVGLFAIATCGAVAGIALVVFATPGAVEILVASIAVGVVSGTLAGLGSLLLVLMRRARCGDFR